jgi:hypothetical protein
MAGDGHPLRIGEARQKTRIVAVPAVSGVSKRSKAMSRSAAVPAVLRGSNVSVDPEQIGVVVFRFDRTQPLVVRTVRGADFLRSVVGGEVVDVRDSLQKRLQFSPDFTHPRDVRGAFGCIRPLADGIEIPLRAARAKRCITCGNSRDGAMDIEEKQRVER